MVKTWSDGESTYMRISSTITGFSAARSLRRRSGRVASSPITFRAVAAAFAGTRARVRGQLPIRAGIDRTAAALDQLGQSARVREVRGALEDEVLEQMRETCRCVVLVS